MSNTYYLRFGQGDPRQYTGLTPTLAVFKLPDGTDVTAPTLSEIPSTGIFQFSYGPTTSIAFLADGFTSGLGLGTVGRYVVGSIDPADSIGAFIGQEGSTFGGISTNPVDLFGYAKRAIENLEGNQSFFKNSGALTIYSRGSSSILAEKVITNSISTVIKT